MRHRRDAPGGISGIHYPYEPKRPPRPRPIPRRTPKRAGLDKGKGRWNFFHVFVLALVVISASSATLLSSNTSVPISAASTNGSLGSSLLQVQSAPPQNSLTSSSADKAQSMESAPAPAVAPVEDNASQSDPIQSIEERLRSLQAQMPSPTPTATPASDCDDSPLYCIYTVRSGDTLSGIAKTFELEASGDLSPADLVAQSNQPDIVDSDDIVSGQQLRIPKQNGIIHTVLTAETLGELATRYGVTAETIDAANGISASGVLPIGAVLLIPNPTHNVVVAASPPAGLPEAEDEATEPAEEDVPEETEATPTPEAVEEEAVEEEVAEEATEEEAGTAVPPPIETTAPTETATPTPSPTATSSASRTTTPSTTGTPPARSRSGFIWPGNGPISSYFGPSHPLGIDIDFYNDPNQNVVASAGGKVTFAGGDACCSYGLYVVIEHANGYTTLYAHLSSISVREGQTVTQGQVLGRGGRTGNATGNHLHFELRYDGTPLNPLDYLPPR